MSSVELTIENLTINHLRTGFARAVLAQLTFETWRLMYHWRQRNVEEQGWLIWETQLNCSYSPAVMCWHTAPMCHFGAENRRTGGRKRLSYTLGRMQNGCGYQIAVWLNRPWFIVGVINSCFQYSLPRAGCEQNHRSKTFVLKCEMNLGQENEFLHLAHMLVKGEATEHDMKLASRMQLPDACSSFSWSGQDTGGC